MSLNIRWLNNLKDRFSLLFSLCLIRIIDHIRVKLRYLFKFYEAPLISEPFLSKVFPAFVSYVFLALSAFLLLPILLDFVHSLIWCQLWIIRIATVAWSRSISCSLSAIKAHFSILIRIAVMRRKWKVEAYSESIEVHIRLERRGVISTFWKINILVLRENIVRTFASISEIFLLANHQLSKMSKFQKAMIKHLEWSEYADRFRLLNLVFLENVYRLSRKWEVWETSISLWYGFKFWEMFLILRVTYTTIKRSGAWSTLYSTLKLVIGPQYRFIGNHPLFIWTQTRILGIEWEWTRCVCRSRSDVLFPEMYFFFYK